MSIVDLFGARASESLVQEIASQQEDDGRLEGIEEAIRSVDAKIGDVEEALRSEVEEALRQRQQAQAQAQVEPVAPRQPEFVTVIVTRNGRAAEYKFRGN